MAFVDEVYQKDIKLLLNSTIKHPANHAADQFLIGNICANAMWQGAFETNSTVDNGYPCGGATRTERRTKSALGWNLRACMCSQIGRRSVKEVRIITKIAEPAIAQSAKEAADHTSRVIVVYREAHNVSTSAGTKLSLNDHRGTLTNRADAALGSQEYVVLFNREPVRSAKVS